MLNKRIKFEVKNGAYEPNIINSRVITVCGNLCRPVKDLTGVSDSTERYYVDVKEQFNNRLAALDLNHYYMPDGAKVTKPIKKILLTFLTKKELEPIWPEICKQVSELYSPAFQAVAYFGEKSLLGTGAWEGRTTCFNSDGINAQNGVFIQKFKRTQILVVEEVGTSNKARCLVYFQGGRNINLFNFYYNGFRQNNLVFVEALRRLLSIPKISYKEESVNLPIYLNGDGLVIHTPKSFVYDADRMFPCPHCDTKLPERKMLTAVEGNTYKIGCCEECLDENTETCCVCGDSVEEDGMRTSDNGDIYCESCYSDNFAYCDYCNNEVPVENYLGNGLCSDCGAQCHNCGRIHKNDDMSTGPDDESYCQDCFSDKFSFCEGCETDVDRDDIKEGPDGNLYCQDCYDNIFIECDECNEVIEKDESVKDCGKAYCQDCYDALNEEEEEEESALNAERAPALEGVTL